jgi:branched-chain amino acid transport system substrate-binding protein
LRPIHFLALAATLLALAACRDDRPEVVSPPLRIAVEAPLSGEQASNGQDMLRGVMLAVDEANARGGVLGRRVEIIEADDKADPAGAAALAGLVADAGAVAVIGPYNSAVGLQNLPVYEARRVVAVHLTSSDATAGYGITVQPKNSQISPVEIDWIAARSPRRVVALVDPSAYTQSMADRLATGLAARGISVTLLPAPPGAAEYSALVATALALQPDLIYVSTYFPEGALIARALAAEAAAGRDMACFMGLANQDPAFVRAAGVADSQRCVFSGVPLPMQFPEAADYVAAYRRSYPGLEPGTWGTFTYDSAKLLFNAIERVGSAEPVALLAALRATTGFPGATGPITLEPATGNRSNVPVRILRVDASGQFVVVN